MPELGRLRQAQHAAHETDAPREHEPARAFGVEDGPDLDAAEEGEEDVEAEDPADGARAVCGELVRAEVGLVGSDCVH